MGHVDIVVADLAAATAFFVDLGLKLQGEGLVEDGWVDRVVGLAGVRVEFAMMGTADGHGRLELIKFHAPLGRGGDRQSAGEHPGHPPCLFRGRRHRGCRRQLASPRRGARRRGGARYADSYLLCYIRGPEGIIVELAEQLRAPAGRHRLALVSGRQGRSSADACCLPGR